MISLLEDPDFWATCPVLRIPLGMAMRPRVRVESGCENELD
jgi:hypothetical protein